MAIDILSKLNTGGSGLDLVSLSSQLASATYEPRRALLTARMDRADLSASALDRVTARMSDLSATLQAAAGIDTLSAKSSAPGLVDVTLSDASLAPARPVEIEVLGLAQSQVLEFGGFSGPDQVLGGGTLTVDIGRWQGDPPAFSADPARSGAQLVVPAGATLTQLAEALSSLPGVTARAIEVGDGGWSLGILSETGAASSLRISASADSAPEIAALDFSADPRPVERRVASDALMTVDGIAVLRPTNQVDDLIPGLSLTLSGVTPAPVTIRAETDPETALGVMEGLVEEFNGLKSLLQQVTARGGNGTEPGALAGDAGVMSLMRELDAMLAGGLAGFGPQPVILADLGLRTERDGRLSLDRSVFEAGFAADPSRFRSVLQDNLASTGPGVAINGMPARGATPGRYEFLRDPATGAATLNGVALNPVAGADGMTGYRVATGPLAGISLVVEPGVTQSTIEFGRSLGSQLTAWVDTATGRDGVIGRKQDRLEASLTEDGDSIETLTNQQAAYEARMRARFAEMEKVITQLNSTGEYLTSLIDSFNAPR